VAVLDSADAEAQSAFSAALAMLLRDSRIRQGMTQAQVSARTGGLVSKAALANYETGHRSLRVDVFWLLVRALGEDAAVLLSSAERRSGYGRNADAVSALTVDIAAVQANGDPRRAPVQRWFDLRLQSGAGRPSVRTVTLDEGALAALASLMGVSRHECRALLAETGASPAERRSRSTVSPVVVGADVSPGSAGTRMVAAGRGTLDFMDGEFGDAAIGDRLIDDTEIGETGLEGSVVVNA
jgi:transcriptional regulator with XRE-family HTH domain